MSAITGTIVAQLFVLEQPQTGFGYATIGRPLASVCFSFSICTVLLGTCRFWRHQHAMIHGKALTGGFEIVVLGIVSLLVCCLAFSFTSAVCFLIGDFSTNTVYLPQIAMVFFGFLVGIDVATYG